MHSSLTLSRPLFFCVAGLAAELQLRVYSHECHSGVTLGHGVEGRPGVMLNSTCRPSPPLVFVLRCVAWPPFNLLSDRPQLGQAADVAGRWWRGGAASWRHWVRLREPGGGIVRVRV